MSGAGETANVTNTFQYNPALMKIVTRMYRIIAAIEENEEPTPGMYNDAVEALQSVLKELAVSGIHVWAEEEGLLFLNPGQRRYLVGPNSTDHVCDANDFTLNSLQQNALTGTASLTLSGPALNSKVGQQYGVVLDTGVTFWSTIKAITGANVVEIADNLPSQASAGENTFQYTTNIIRPLKIPLARRLQYLGFITTPVPMLSRQEFMDLPQNYQPGIVTQAFYAPTLINGTDGSFYVWPVAQDSYYGVRFTWYRPLMDAGNVNNTQDVPQEWSNTLTWLLAKEMGPEFEVPAQRWAQIVSVANEKLINAQNFDRETEDIEFSMDYTNTQRS